MESGGLPAVFLGLLTLVLESATVYLNWKSNDQELLGSLGADGLAAVSLLVRLGVPLTPLPASVSPLTKPQ